MKNKSLLEKVRALFTEEETVTLEQWTEGEIVYEAEVLEVDNVLSIVTEDATEPAPAGDYTIAGNTVTVGEDGVITAVVVIEAEPVEETTDEPTVPANLAEILQVNKWSLNVDNESFNEGDTVTITYGEGEDAVSESLQAGEYELENGDVIHIDSSGVIVLKTVKAGSTEPAEASTEPATDPVEQSDDVKLIEDIAANKANLVELTQTVTELSEVIDELVTVLSDQKTKQKETNHEEKETADFKEYVNFKRDEKNTEKLNSTRDRVFQRLFGDQ